MSSSETVLAFDTSGAFCDVALLSGGRVVAQAHEDMARGQAEKLMPMIADVMGEARIGRRNLSAIGVGIGPGNFTGLRIAVAAARGMALGLGIPALGVDTFAAILEADGLYAGRILIIVPAPRDEVYAQEFQDGAALGPARLCPRAALEMQGYDRVVEVTPARAKLGAGQQLPTGQTGVYRYAAAIARVAQRRLSQALREGAHLPRPAPLYIKAPDALPPRAAQIGPG